jgi:hypothetical protein
MAAGTFTLASHTEDTWGQAQWTLRACSGRWQRQDTRARSPLRASHLWSSVPRCPQHCVYGATCKSSSQALISQHILRRYSRQFVTIAPYVACFSVIYLDMYPVGGLPLRRNLALCRWEDPDDLAVKAHKFIESNWAAAYQLYARPKAWTKPT